MMMFLQDDISAEEQEQLDQDIAELSGASSGSDFNEAEPEMQQPSKKAGAAKLHIKAARKSSGCVPTILCRFHLQRVILLLSAQPASNQQVAPNTCVSD